MCIIIVSRNIFRRELSGYILAEAGFETVEAASVSALVDQLGSVDAQLLLVDLGLQDDLSQIDQLSTVPIIWLQSEHAVPRQLPKQAHVVDWPFEPTQLLRPVNSLLEHALLRERTA